MILKNYADRGVRPRRITPCENPIIVLFFIANNSQCTFKTSRNILTSNDVKSSLRKQPNFAPRRLGRLARRAKRP